jgi:periplasmic copper chaperone A
MSFIRNAAIAASLLVIAIAGLAPVARAHDYTHGQLRIGHPWTRATAPSAKVAAGYLTIRNTGGQADRLISASFTSSGSVELHEMAVDNGVMRMRELPRGIDIAPGQTVELKPGGLHLMFMDLKTGLREGGAVKGALVFEKAGLIEVDFKVEAMGARSGQAGHDHGHHGHGHGHGHQGHVQPPRAPK